MRRASATAGSCSPAAGAEPRRSPPAAPVYLTCPRCQTVYAVRAAMLREGQGEVRCGACRTVFNALDCLSDELPVQAGEPPEHGAMLSGQVAALPEKAAASSGPGGASFEHGGALPGHGGVPFEHGGALPGHGEVSFEKGGALPGRGEALPEHDFGAAHAPARHPAAARAREVPEALRSDLARADEPPPSPRTRNTGLWLAALVLLGCLGLQYLWFAPEDLAARFPQVRAEVRSFCLAAGCLERRRRAPEQIRMLSRDVRAHPRYEGALLVSATFTNTAAWAQPFPRLRFTLYDVNGAIIAARTFTPSQYLAGVLPADSDLPPGQPVQVSLEMLAPEEAAVSFEFRFL